MNDLLRLLTLQDPSTRTVLLGAALLGIAAGVVGCFTLLRRRALVGDALAHAALPGVCIAYLIAGGRSFAGLLLGALCSGVVAVMVLAVLRSRTKVRDDAALGIVLSGFFALGIVLSSILQRSPRGSPAGLETFIYGQAAVMTRQDLITLGAVAGASLLTIAVFFRPFTALCFDESFSRVIGLRAALTDFLLMALVCMVTIAGLPAAGVVLIAALLIIPAVTARFWTHHLGAMLAIAGFTGLVSATGGVAVSAVADDVPAGPAITLLAGAIFALSLLLAPRRGVLARAVARLRLRRRTAMQNLLRALFEVRETSHRPATTHDLALKRSWSLAKLHSLIARAQRDGTVRHTPDGSLALTDLGEKQAAAVVRAHRLWELFLIEEATLAHDHVDRDADLIEHVLSPEVIRELEDRLRSTGRLPGSPHPIAQRSDAEAHA